MDREYTTTSKITKRMDFHPTVFMQIDRISKFIREMDHWSAKDIMKLERMINDLEADLSFHIRETKEKKKLTLTEMGKINGRLSRLDLFDDCQKYIKALLEKKAEIIYLAGKAEILPVYKDGMPRNVR